MTELQQLMLSVCFGAVVGMLIGNLVSIVSFAVSGIKEKHRRRKEAKQAKDFTTEVD